MLLNDLGDCGAGDSARCAGSDGIGNMFWGGDAEAEENRSAFEALDVGNHLVEAAGLRGFLRTSHAVAGDGINVTLGVLSHACQGLLARLCRGDEDWVDTSLFRGRDEWGAFAHRDVGKQDAICTRIAELLIEVLDAAGEWDVAVDQHADGKLRKLGANLLDLLNCGIDGRAVG